MSDNNAQSYQDGNATSMRSHHSVWMAHWTRTGCKSASQACNDLSISYESGEESSHTRKRPLLDGPMRAADTLKHDNGSGEVAGVGVHNPNNESLTGRSKKKRKERLGSEPFPMLNVSQHREGKLALNVEQATISQEGPLKFQTGSSSGHKTSYVDGKESQSPSLLAFVPERGKAEKEHIKSKGIKEYPSQHENSNKFLDNNSLTVSTFVRDEIMGTASKFIPYEMSSSRIPFTACEQNISNQSNSYLSSKRQVGNANFHRYSTLFIQETKINQILDSMKSADPLLRQNMRTFLLHNPSSSNLDQPNLFPKCDTRKSSSSTLPFQSQSDQPVATRPEHLYHGGYPLQRLPNSVHDVETMRIFTSADSVEEALRGPPKFSQATHRFMITKQTDISLCKGQEFREAAATTNLKGKVTGAHLGLTTNFGIHDQKENELIKHSATIDGEIENFGNMRTSTACLSNESSETDIMDMDAFHEDHLTGADTSLADKNLESLKSRLLSASVTSSVRKEIGDELPKKRLPDINERPSDLSASASLMDNRESSTSKTQSLDVEHLLSNAEKPRVSNSTAHLDDSPSQEMHSRWVKRLKPCTSESVHNTKRSKNEEASSCDSSKKLFNKMKCSSTCSERSVGQLLGKEQLAVGQTATMVKDSDWCSNFSRKNREIILSNPWIRRWCHNRPVPSQRNLEPGVVQKPECSKSTLDKPFPSIAAMALMGKTVTGFRPCEFSKRGSSLVWNTGGI